MTRLINFASKFSLPKVHKDTDWVAASIIFVPLVVSSILTYSSKRQEYTVFEYSLSIVWVIIMLVFYRHRLSSTIALILWLGIGISILEAILSFLNNYPIQGLGIMTIIALIGIWGVWGWKHRGKV